MITRLLAVFMLACGGLATTHCTPSKEANYPYQEALALYFERYHSITLPPQAETIYYLLPLAACSPCLEKSLTLLMELPTDTDARVVPVMVGTPTEKRFEPLAQQVGERHTHTLWDAAGAADRFRLGLQKPLFIHYKNGQVVHYQVVSDFEVPAAKTYLAKLLQ